jgi:hypothetical protein
MKQLLRRIAAQKKKIFLAVMCIAVLIQFIRPERNEGSISSVNDITKATSVSPEIQSILATSCFDCHSDKTQYPWYTNIQPIGWLMASHVTDGKKEVNFSQFNTYSIKRKMKKYHEIEEQLEEGEMPLDSYLWIHRDAKLSPTQKKLVMDWAVSNRIALEQQFPDSIAKKRLN